MQPLVKEARDLFEQHSVGPNSNKGLLFERFYNGYDNDFSVNKEADTRELRKLVGRCGHQQQLADSTTRRIQLVTALEGSFGVFATDWHFVTGTGNNHPAENGFSWHHTLGTPYLPGTAVKGLLRAWLEGWKYAGDENKTEREKLVHEWFGRDAKKEGANDAGKAGDLIFFDALPIEPPSVLLDIMTPHMGKWYERGDGTINHENQPGDWHSPVPINFLVTSDARFVFSIAPRTAAAKSYVKEAMEHLKDALAWLGAGAKTAAGYGHMSFDEQDTLQRFERAELAEREAEEARKRAALSEEQRLIHDFTERRQAGEDKGKGAGCTLVTDLGELCEAATQWEEEDREQLVAEVREVLKHAGVNLRKNTRWKERLRSLA